MNLAKIFKLKRNITTARHSLHVKSQTLYFISSNRVNRLFFLFFKIKWNQFPYFQSLFFPQTCGHSDWSCFSPLRGVCVQPFQKISWGIVRLMQRPGWFHFFKSLLVVCEVVDAGHSYCIMLPSDWGLNLRLFDTYVWLLILFYGWIFGL